VDEIGYFVQRSWELSVTKFFCIVLMTLFILPVGASPRVGQPAPSFNLPSSLGHNLQLQDFSGGWLVLYFYPEDPKAGCTIQARRFEQDLPTFGKLNTRVVGVTMANLGPPCDGPTQLTDPFGELGAAYGAPTGSRQTYIIDPQGFLRRVFTRVNPLSHSREVLTVLRELQQPRKRDG